MAVVLDIPVTRKPRRGRASVGLHRSGEPARGDRGGPLLCRTGDDVGAVVARVIEVDDRDVVGGRSGSFGIVRTGTQGRALVIHDRILPPYSATLQPADRSCRRRAL